METQMIPANIYADILQFLQDIVNVYQGDVTLTSLQAKAMRLQNILEQNL